MKNQKMKIHNLNSLAEEKKRLKEKLKSQEVSFGLHIKYFKNNFLGVIISSVIPKRFGLSGIITGELLPLILGLDDGSEHNEVLKAIAIGIRNSVKTAGMKIIRKIFGKKKVVEKTEENTE